MTADTGIPDRRSGRAPRQGATSKATFRLDRAVLEAVKGFVDAGMAESQTAFVDEAIRAHLRRLRRDQLAAAYDAAAADPEFMSDMDATTVAYEGTTGDGL